ncbi:pilus assembly PilX N-terminal domain-containing protein [Dehalococcoidia bacterium]|nr:pilus assembly PilX N-terminal domain-containing protein [Dehalococcoidia bacterium]
MSRKNEQGMVLVYVLIFLVVGSLLVASLVPVVGAGSRRHIAGRGQMLAGYAAEAGIKRVVADLVRGADAFSPHYTVPQITVNEHTPTIDIRAATIALPSDQLYVDPGVWDPSLSAIPAGTGYLMRLHHVKEGELRINWAYSPAGPTKLGISEGLTPQAAGRIYAWPEEHLIATAESSGDYNYISVDITDPGIYTIVFFNPLEIEEDPNEEYPNEEEERVLMPNTDKVTNPFGPGGSENTWICVRAHQDYIITAAAADVSVSAYVRQVPGPSEPSGWITNEVLIYSWNPP